MKRLSLFIALAAIAVSVSAQTKVAYCDVYVRGGGQNLKVTIMYNNTPHKIFGGTNRTNMGDVLNIFAADGWVLDKDIVIPRFHWWSWCTRHKLHLIMKKEYQTGENPFAMLQSSRYSNNIATISTKQTFSQTANQENNKTQELPINSHSFQAGDKVVYRGTSAYIMRVYDDKVMLAASIGNKYAAWNIGVAFCQKLGKDWRLPSLKELRDIESLIENNIYWTSEAIDADLSLAYDSSSDQQIICRRFNNYFILPIAIVNTNEL